MRNSCVIKWCINWDRMLAEYETIVHVADTKGAMQDH